MQSTSRALHMPECAVFYVNIRYAQVQVFPDGDSVGEATTEPCLHSLDPKMARVHGLLNIRLGDAASGPR